MLAEQDTEDSDELLEPAKQSLCGSIKRDTHWKNLVLSVLIYASLTAITWCRLTVVSRERDHHSILYHLPEKHSPCRDGYVYIPVAFVALVYLIYIIECWKCHTRKELKLKASVNEAYDMLQTMREAIPIVWWKSICYHYMRRTRKVTRYRNGDAFTSTQVYYERVNSHIASSCFNFMRCGIKDVSKQLLKLEKYPATKIELSKGFSFSSYDSEQEYEQQRTQFFHSYECSDDYMETREGLNLMNIDFKPCMIVFTDTKHPPWYVSEIVFWMASLLVMSWPLRVFIGYKTAYVHLHIHKLFGCNYHENSHLDSTLMVPSYSEALLMDCPNKKENYGALTSPQKSSPLIHIGNSICIAPSSNSIYMPSTPIPNNDFSVGSFGEPSYGTTYTNVTANGYIPLSGGNSIGSQTEYKSTSKESWPNTDKKNVTQKHNKTTDKHSLDHEFCEIESDKTESDMENESISHLIHDKSSSHQNKSKHHGYSKGRKTHPNGDTNLSSPNGHCLTSSTSSDSLPSYDLVLAMRRAAALAAGILPSPIETTNPSQTSDLVDQSSKSNVLPASHSCITVSETARPERPLPSSKSMVSTCLQSQASGDQKTTELLPLKLHQTTL